MRLYLASNDLGEFSAVLVKMVGANHKALVISNARDHHDDASRKAIVDEDMGFLAACGFEPEELDLRPYFGKSKELRQYVDEFVPGLVFAMGGNVFGLTTALHLSGMDEILYQDLKEDKYVYGGYSAGSMVAAKDLMNYLDSYGKRGEDKYEIAKEIYGEVYTDGLGLIEEYICPHADEIKFHEARMKMEEQLKNKGLKTIVLNNADVVIVENDTTKTLRP